MAINAQRVALIGYGTILLAGEALTSDPLAAWSPQLQNRILDQISSRFFK
jgi:hypothetical protein